jgi:hypothetical protein
MHESLGLTVITAKMEIGYYYRIGHGTTPPGFESIAILERS